MLNAELISHHILSQYCSWRLQLERCFSSAVVENLMSSFKLIRILLLQWLAAYCFSCAAVLGWGRVLRTPTSPFALKGECHKSQDIVGTDASEIAKFQCYSRALIVTNELGGTRGTRIPRSAFSAFLALARLDLAS